MGNKNMDNLKKLATMGIQDTGQRQAKQMHHNTQTNINNVNNSR